MSMKPVTIYQPAIKVTLYKTIQRKSLDGANMTVSGRFSDYYKDEIDLTNWLGEGCSVRTSKNVREPAGGFSISFVDQGFNVGSSLESLYGMIEPMDVFEIRMQHVVNSKTPSSIPIVMRGFVSSISRSQTMGADGRPQRVVNISGQDYGKLWQLMRINYFAKYIVGEALLSNFKLFEQYGVGFKTGMLAQDFAIEVVQKIIDPYLTTLLPQNTKLPKTLNVSSIAVPQGTTSISGAQNAEGSFYDILKRFGDVGIWNELYTEDREDGVYVVYRPNPTLKIDGKTLCNPDATMPTVVNIPDIDVISINVSRSDSGVANFYWVNAPRFDLVSDQYQRLYALASSDLPTVDLETYINSSSAIYGSRVMQVGSEQGGNDTASWTSGNTKAGQDERATTISSWIIKRRQILVDQNKDNVLFESGAMRIRGNEAIKAGMYVIVTQGTFASQFYVTQVDHEYIPYVGFFTTLIIERGTGFINRVEQGSGLQSPYLQELNNG